MAMLGKRRPSRVRSGVSGLQGRRTPRDAPHAGAEETTSRVIERLAHDGRGVAHHPDGKALFVEGGLPGERLEVAIHRAHKRYDEAHIRELFEASPERVAPPCGHFAHCGGCDLQHLDVEAQRRHKPGVLVELLTRQEIESPSPVLLAGSPDAYRRKARLGVRVDAEGEVHLGFRARHSHRLVDITDCTVLMRPLNALLLPLRDFLASLEAPRQVGHLELLDSDQGAILVVRQLRDHSADSRRWRLFAESHGLHLAQWRGRDSPRLEWLTPVPSLSCRVPGPQGDLTLGFAPGDFLQANAEVNRRMIETALNWLGDARGRRMLDLYAGVGNFSLPLAAAGADVTAVEGASAMVDRLVDNARRNGLTLRAQQADLASDGVVASVLDASRPDWVLLDPPRDGAERACRALAARPVARVLYVSCDPATLARDAAHLVRGGYRLSRACVADMFTHTSHLEAMLLFEHPRTERQPQGVSADG
ncbi:TRAM domain-containing protein [Halomonas sp.]|uniref:TRAM domain-containing protein n=1 Tax=Halomonas sp. TaxID=1486246 RepID=UPI003568957E